MNGWQRWVKAPQTLGFRRFLFQVHLWMGIGFGLYVLVISVSGSAVVLRPQFSLWFVHSRVPATEGQALSGAALETAVAGTYNGYAVTRIVPPARPNRAVYVALEKDGKESTRYFDQYTGMDLGSTFPWPVRTVEWLTRLHDDLFLEQHGRTVNGIGGILVLVMVMSGIIIWWQGRGRWQDGLVIKRGGTHSFMWQLHSFLGFWSFFLLFVWGITAVYFAFPEPFDFVINAMDSDLDDIERPDGWLLFLIDLHFGRFRGSWLAYVWIFLGLLPAVMFITGFILWYRRQFRKFLAGAARDNGIE